jgi:hypothetical protein
MTETFLKKVDARRQHCNPLRGRATKHLDVEYNVFVS